MFSLPASLLAAFYSITHSYAAAIGLITVVVMALITPLTLKSTKGMLEMQKLQPQMRRLQQQHRNDRQKLNEEMMRLYQEHKVNPLASCLPLAAQMPVFFIMYRLLRDLSRPVKSEEQAAELTSRFAGILHGRTIRVGEFFPDHVDKGTALFKSLLGKTQMRSIGLDLSRSPKEMLAEGFGRGFVYFALVVVLGVLYWLQQRQIASRTVSPTMSVGQQKLMQYLPVFFAVFQVFFPTGLVLYYITQTVLRIGQQAYVTRRFYRGEHSLGHQAQRAGHEARELAKQHKEDNAGGPRKASGGRPGGGGPKAAGKAAGTASGAKGDQPAGKSSSAGGGRPKPSGRVTPSNKPAPSGGRPTRPAGRNTPPGSRHPKPKKK